MMIFVLKITAALALAFSFFTALNAAAFDVKAYGAIGDGKAADRDSINKAIDAASAADQLKGVDLQHVKAQKAAGVPTFVLQNVDDFTNGGTHLPKTDHKEF